MPSASERGCVRKFLIYMGVDPRELPQKKPGRPPAGAARLESERPLLTDEQERERARGRMKANAGLFEFKQWLVPFVNRYEIKRILRNVRKYLETNEPTLEAFAAWAPTVDTKTRTHVRKYLIYLGIDYKDTLVAVSEKQRKANEARARFYEQLGEQLRNLPAPFTIDAAAQALGVSKDRIRQYLASTTCYRLPAFYSGETARRTYVYAFEPFADDEVEYELNDPIERDDITLEIQLFGEMRAAYEELKSIKDKWEALDPEQIRERLKKCLTK